MPKKTRTQKMSAQRRRMTVPAIQSTPSSVDQSQPKKTIKSPSNALFQADTTYFQQDLTKSILISSIIFFIEVGFYLAQQFGFMHITKLFQF